MRYDLANGKGEISKFLLERRSKRYQGCSLQIFNGKKSKLNRNDFQVLATSLKINDKSLDAIYKRFEDVLPKWISWIEQSFLSEEMKEAYLELIQKRHQKLF